jgi:hypothetical protein
MCALLAATIPAVAVGQSASPSAVPVEVPVAPSSSPAQAEAARAGWALYQRQEPAISVQLPTGWQEVAGDGTFAASGPAGEMLELAVEDVPGDVDFDAYVTRQEKVLEKSRKQSVPTVFRMTSSGLVARLDQAPRKGEPAGSQTSLFLYPTCDDGARTLTIVGSPPEPTLDGSPDAWDEVAAAVNPCAADPAAALMIDPEVAALAGQYYALVTAQNAKVAELQAVLSRGVTVAEWRKQSRKIGTALTDTSERLEALPWTEETRPLVDALMAAYADETEVWTELSTARNVRAVESKFDDLDRAGTARTTAGRAIRLALGLPTVSR